MMLYPHDPNPASGAAFGRSAASGDASTLHSATIDSAYRLLVIRGLSPVEAGNLVAFINGLHPAEGGWTVAQIKHLVAIRSLVATGRVES